MHNKASNQPQTGILSSNETMESRYRLRSDLRRALCIIMIRFFILLIYQDLFFSKDKL